MQWGFIEIRFRHEDISKIVKSNIFPFQYLAYSFSDTLLI